MGRILLRPMPILLIGFSGELLDIENAVITCMHSYSEEAEMDFTIFSAKIFSKYFSRKEVVADYE